MRPMSRIQPQMRPEAYNTYSITSPHDVLVKAACEQVGCQMWLHGWQSQIDESTDLGRTQADYIRTQSGRTFREQHTADGVTVFTFDSRQRCFADHRTRPEKYDVKHGDWRRSTVIRVHARPADWVEDFAEHQDRLKTTLERG